MLTMSGFHGTKHFVTRARKKRIMADYGGLWRIMSKNRITADYGGLWWITADYGGFRRIMADLADYGGLCPKNGLWRILPDMIKSRTPLRGAGESSHQNLTAIKIYLMCAEIKRNYIF